MKEELMQYAALAKFLKEALGERYSVSLVDADDITDIRSVEERTLTKGGDNNAKGLMNDIIGSKELSKRDYLCSYIDDDENGAGIKTSVFSIKNDGGIAGFLCIEERDSGRFTVRDVMEKLLEPDGEETHGSSPSAQRIGEEVDSLLKEKISEVWLRYNKPGERLKKADKVAFILELMELGVFRIKGAAVQVSEVTGMSQASIYRYLSEAVEE